jgi:tartrate dehydrogenase/decarboxylase/D-malate dehydrogenase
MTGLLLKCIPGDGIGKEVVDEGIKILKRVADVHGGVRFTFDLYAWGCEYYLQHQKMMPDDALSTLQDCDAILLGAVGFPGVPDHISLRGLLLPIRQGFEQYINLRPIRLLDGLISPLKTAATGEDIDLIVVRENSEGEYCGKGYFLNQHTEDETAVQEAWFSKNGTERVIKYAFDLAVQEKRKSVVSATKSNSLNYSMVFWDTIFKEISAAYPEIESRSVLIDALCGLFILQPRNFDVVVASNLFGDILTDLGSAMLGSIGISPSANINPDRKHPSMFEPVHGSAPDIAGKGIANPIGVVWAIVLMLEHLHLTEMSHLLMAALEATLRENYKTPDLGGRCTTTEVVEEICRKMG